MQDDGSSALDAYGRYWYFRTTFGGTHLWVDSLASGLRVARPGPETDAARAVLQAAREAHEAALQGAH